jgi:hypothetical protein
MISIGFYTSKSKNLFFNLFAVKKRSKSFSTVFIARVKIIKEPLIDKNKAEFILNAVLFHQKSFAKIF